MEQWKYPAKSPEKVSKGCWIGFFEAMVVGSEQYPKGLSRGHNMPLLFTLFSTKRKECQVFTELIQHHKIF